MTLGTVLLIVLVLLLIGAIPGWPHSNGWATVRVEDWGRWWCGDHPHPVGDGAPVTGLLFATGNRSSGGMNRFLIPGNPQHVGLRISPQED